MSWQQPQPPYPQQPGAAAYPGAGVPYPVQPGMAPQAYPGQQQVYPPQGQPPMPMGYPAQPQPMVGQPQPGMPMAGAMSMQYPQGAMVMGQGTVRIQFGATKLLNKDFVGRSDPFFVISRIDSKGKTGTPLHKSEVVNNNLSPIWQPFTTSVDKFCGGDYHQTVKMEIFDKDIAGKDEPMGFVTFTLREIMDAKTSGRKFQVEGAKQMGIKRSRAGEIFVQDFALWQEVLPK